MHKNKTLGFKRLTLDIKIFLWIKIRGGFGTGIFHFGLDQKISRYRDQGFRIPENSQKKSPIPKMGIWDFRGQKISKNPQSKIPRKGKIPGMGISKSRGYPGTPIFIPRSLSQSRDWDFFSWDRISHQKATFDYNCKN